MSEPGGWARMISVGSGARTLLTEGDRPCDRPVLPGPGASTVIDLTTGATSTLPVLASELERSTVAGELAYRVVPTGGAASLVALNVRTGQTAWSVPAPAGIRLVAPGDGLVLLEDVAGFVAYG